MVMDKSRLEDLPDEIIIAICLYLNSFDIIYSFARLNKRFQRAISQFRHELDLSLFSLNQFEKFYSPSLFNFVCQRLKKLTLSNEYCPGQIQLFDQLINDDHSYETKLPFLNQLTLSEFKNENQYILSKILYIEQIDLQFSSYETVTKQTEKCLISNFFIKENRLRKLFISADFGLQIEPNIGMNSNLKDLTIQLKTVDDLFNLFSIVPNLTNLEVGIYQSNPLIRVPNEKLSNNLKELYLHTQDAQIIPFEQILKPLLLNLSSIEYISFGMKTNDPIYADGLFWTDLIHSLPHLKTVMFGFEIDITDTLFNYFAIQSLDELKQFVYQSFLLNLPSYSVSIYANNQTLFIDSVPYRYSREQSYNSSPEASRALITDKNLFKQSSLNIIGLSLSGFQYPFDINDYLSVINRFSSIEWLFLDSINIKQNNPNENSIDLKLKNLKSLFYFRSTLCQINRNLFEKIFSNHRKLDSLKMMYGDLIYFLRKISPSINGNHIRKLSLFCTGADGHIRFKHLHYLIDKFPSIEHLFIEISSTNLFKKDQQLILNQLIKSFPKLRSFEMISKKGEFRFIRSFIDDQFNCLSNLNALGSHVIVQPKYFALWISNSQTAFI